MHPNAKLQNAPTFTGNGSHSHVCLLLLIKIETYTYQLCILKLADTNVLIGDSRYQFGGYRLSADYRCIVYFSVILHLCENCRACVICELCVSQSVSHDIYIQC